MTATLPRELVRQVRLSHQSHVDLAAPLGVSPSLIQKIRAGRSGGPLAPDEARAKAARETPPSMYTPPLDCLVVGRLQSTAMADQDRQEAKDAAHECAHGRLPHDRTPACGCWPQEQTNPNPRRIHDHHHARLERLAAQATATPTAIPDRVFDDRALVA